MIGPRLQPRHAKPAQQLADRALGHADRPAGRDLLPVDRRSASRTTLLRSRSGPSSTMDPALSICAAFSARGRSGAATRTQSGHAFRVVAQHPVTQASPPIHAVQLAPPPRVDGPPAPVLLPCKRRTTAPACVRAASSLSSVAESFKTGEVLDRPAHPVALPANRRDTKRESYLSRFRRSPPGKSSRSF